jgi:peptidoglycan/LPS O-acetylase OafA/YrhL
MGTLRTLLAISVVLGHSYGVVFVGARNAVQLFYVISGFLISYVLVEKKAYACVREFYINRYLRLYPIYFVIVVLTLLAYLAGAMLGEDPVLFKVFKDAPLEANLLLTFSNAFLFLQDWVMFSGVENGSLVFLVDFSKSEVALWQGLVVPQAWTLGVELSFYAIAPFILTRRAILICLLALSISIRALIVYLGFGLNDPWTYRFFPTELALFLFGALAHQILLPFYKRYFSHISELLSQSATYFLIAVYSVYWLVPLKDLYKSIFLFSVFVLLLPFLFLFQSKRRWDKWIGELSYPIYINHFLVIWILSSIGSGIGLSDKILLSIFAVLASIAFAIVLKILIADPFEGLRDKFRSHSNSSTLVSSDVSRKLPPSFVQTSTILFKL